MSKRAVNIATISEEDVLEEEIGEDGMVAMVSADRSSEERTDADGEVDDVRSRVKEVTEEDTEKRDSIVENDDEDTAQVSSSILSAISSLEGTLTRSTSPSSKSIKSPRATSPALTHPPAAGASSASSNLRRNMSWRGNRSAGSTLNLSGKFVTELTLYDPYSGPVKNSCISLGVFIATDQTMGDHSVYKVSPVSPLSALKIQQQDRVLKVNDISVMGWSHNCLVEFIRNLPLSFVSSEISKDQVFEMPLSMEFRKTGKVIRSAEESPSSKRVAATVRIRNQRASVLSVHDSVVRVRFNCSNNARIRLASDLKGDLKGDLPLYLKTSTSSSNIVTPGVGEESSPDDTVCFRLHQFDVSPPRTDKGEVVVIETPGGDGFLYATSFGSVAVMQGLTAPPSTLLQIDVRFFHLSSVPGGSSVRIRNIHTGQYLSANTERIALVGPDTDMSLPTDTLFEVLRTDR